MSRFEIVPSAGWCISFRSDPIADRPVKHSIEPGKMLVVAQGRAVNERNDGYTGTFPHWNVVDMTQT
ncbi:hypothetical protein [Pseudooceanicola nitratireducens]|uniref:hypothetical protein n=1 Tax=Pseudooceanicola nitratireducens TaxID=517719 RepID=UPI0035125AD0